MILPFSLGALNSVQLAGNSCFYKGKGAAVSDDYFATEVWDKNRNKEKIIIAQFSVCIHLWLRFNYDGRIASIAEELQRQKIKNSQVSVSFNWLYIVCFIVHFWFLVIVPWWTSLGLLYFFVVLCTLEVALNSIQTLLSCTVYFITSNWCWSSEFCKWFGTMSWYWSLIKHECLDFG